MAKGVKPDYKDFLALFLAYLRLLLPMIIIFVAILTLISILLFH